MGNQRVATQGIFRHVRNTITVASVALGLTFAAAAPAQADVGPYARVIDAGGAVVAQFGAFYGAEAGTQIQLAENYAQCRQTTTPCPAPTGPPAYPKVRLDAGSYQLVRPYGAIWPKCVGILAHSGVKLEGPSDAVIENNLTAPAPCAGMVAPLDAVIFAAADSTNINVTGSKLDISGFRINAGYNALYGLEVGPHSGGGLTVHDLTVTKPRSSGILTGPRDLPVKGIAGSPVMITNNIVRDSNDDGITLGGSWQKATGNTVTNLPDHGIVIYQRAGTDHNEVTGNTITGANYGVSMDASTAPGDPPAVPGTDNSVYNNTIGDTCLGIIVYRQIKANIAGNYIYGGRPNADCARREPIFSSSVGIGIQASYNNVAWSNQTWGYVRGVWIQDNGDSPGGIGTHWNYIGVVASWGTPWPWPTAGNWINGSHVGLTVHSWRAPTNDQDNAFIGNVVSGASVIACSFDSPQVLSGNSPSPPC